VNINRPTMKKLIIIFTGLFIILYTVVAEGEKEIKAPVSRVTVYPDRAQLTHEASVSLTAGKTNLKLTGLSPYIDAQSIQVKGIGEYTILAVNLQNNYLQNLEDMPEVKNIRKQIESLQIKIEDEKAAINTLEEKQSFLAANKAILVKESSFSLEQFKNLMDLYTNNIDQIAGSKLKKSRLIKDYEKQVADLQKQISDQQGKLRLPSGEITVSVSSDKAVSGKMSFEYVVSNAGWYPSYDIRVDDINKPVTITYKANVFQNSGVEWKNVKLSFSNATPWVSGNVPVLNPWFINFYTPVTSTSGIRIRGLSSRSAPLMVKKAEAADEAMALNEVVTAAPVAVEKKVGEMAVTFNVSVPYTIVSDGKVQTIEIQKSTMPALYRYVTVPKISTAAYLTGNITDWAKQSLLSGEATMYFENTYVGKSDLNVNQLTDTLVISLGTDNSILVKREKRKDYTTRKVIGANKTETYSFLITIRNNKTSTVSITVNDQIPVSSNNNISVEADELTGGKLDEGTGMVKWDLEVKPGETKELVLTYSVKFPKNQNVILE
jgi:uncharacterized protein (TIGR02231 family)